MNPFLKAAELLYRGVNRTRRTLYRAGILHARRLPVPVISVGNIGAGGAGKTPAVIAICRFLEARGLRVAVLTRGYGRSGEAVDGRITSFDTDKYGDEPVLIKRSISGDVLVGANRYANARQYLLDNHIDVFVLDDGFQHQQLHRDLDVVIDAPAPFAREGRSALRHADLVVPRDLRVTVPESLKGRDAFAVAALADNDQFFETLRREGIALAGTKSLPDHHRYTGEDLGRIVREARNAPIVTTAKDAVKLEALRTETSPVIHVATAEFRFDEAAMERIAAVAGGKREERRERKRRKGRLLQAGEYLTYRAFARAVTSMSEESIERWGARVGALARRVLRKRDRLALTNVRRTFPEKSASETRALVDACWRHFGREVLFSLKMQNLSLDQVAALCPFDNKEILEDAIARGKGTILISAHWGGWEVAGLALMAHVQNVRTVARPLDNELLERDLQRLRAKTGAEVVDRRRAARVLLKGLADNAVIVLLPDQAVLPREGVLVPFLGRPGWTTPAPAKMALKADATIVFAFCRADGVKHRLAFEEAIRVDQLDENERDPVALTARINEVISRRIASRPELWLWMHDRWKGTGESEATDGV